jgi:hypothetical protein
VEHFVGEGRLERGPGEPRHGRPLVPAVLACERGGLASAEAGHRGLVCPRSPGPLGARPHGAMERGEHEGRAHGEWPPGGGAMVIDARHEPKPIGQGFPHGPIAMLVGAERAPGLGMAQEPVEEVVRGAEMEQRDRPRFALDTARLHDAGGGVSTSLDVLHTGPRWYRHEAQGRGKP